MSEGHQLSASSASSTDEIHGSLIHRSWHAMSDLLSPFSQSALAQLPKRLARPRRYTRANEIPDVSPTDENGQMPTVRDYHSITVPPQVRVPKKTPTPVRVESKVWFANERTWVSYINMSILIGTLAVALFNASKDPVARKFAYVYAVISIGILVYGYVLYQLRITMIRRRDPGHFDQIAGPVIISAFLFCAILANFVIRGALQFTCDDGTLIIPNSLYLSSRTEERGCHHPWSCLFNALSLTMVSISIALLLSALVLCDLYIFDKLGMFMAAIVNNYVGSFFH